jgi:amino acid adenylation domain-containing protein
LQDGFFDAGGNSLLVIRLHERLNARWPNTFSVADLFALATIREQAGRIAQAPAIQAPLLSEPLQTFQEPSSVISAHRNPNKDPNSHAIAIVGMAVRLAGSDNLASFWRDVSRGADLVRPLPPAQEKDTRALMAAIGLAAPKEFCEAAYLDDVMSFAPQRLRMSPADAALLEPEQRLFLDTALRALEDAGRGGLALDGARVGVFVGGAPGTAWREALMRSSNPKQMEQVFALNVPSNIATRLSFLHNWRGPAATMDTACSSSLVASHTACSALRNGECEWALVGGAKAVMIPHAAGQLMTIDSSTGRTHAFAEGADGTGIGEGAVVFLLRPLDKALEEGDSIYGVILGSAVNQDGASSGMAAPNPAAQAEVITAAARDAGISLSSLSYIEAHGTGTALGDPVEIEGLTRAFALETSETGFAAIGSAKGNYGHLDGAAGALGMARALMCLINDSAPPQPFFDTPNSRIDFTRAPVFVSRKLARLADRGCPRRVGVSAFGLSGINAHIVLEASPSVDPRPALPGWFVAGLSASNPTGLRMYAGEMVAALRANPNGMLNDIVRTLTEGRDFLDCRLAVSVSDRGDLIERLAVFASTGVAEDRLMVTGTANRGRDGVSAVHDCEAAAAAAAAAFVGGAQLRWPEARPAGRLHLPAAPLDRRRCVPNLVPTTMPNSEAGCLLGPEVSTSLGIFHVIDVHAGSFWPVSEHRLEGVPTLVSMAFPALLAEAFSGKALRIRDLRWIRPLRPAELVSGTVTLAIGSDGVATISGRTKDERWLTFAKAAVEVLNASESDRLDLGALDPIALAERCAEPLEAPPFQKQHGIIEVSERWDCLEHIAYGKEEYLGWLHAPGGDSSLQMHPGLLDVATGLALQEPGLIPAGCATIEVAGALPADPLVHVTRHITEFGIEADVQLADRKTGRIAARLLGLRFTRLAGEPRSSEIELALPRWRPEPLEVKDSGGMVVVIGEGTLAERISDCLSAAKRLAARSGSDNISAMTAACIGALDVPAIVFVPAGGPDLGVRAAAAMRRILSALRHPTRLLALGEGAFAADAGKIDPLQALTYGIVTAAALEEPLLIARYIDTDETGNAADLLAELAVLERNPGAIAWRRGQRLIRWFETIPDRKEDAKWPVDGCCVVTGGTGGLALMLAETLAVGGKVSLAFLSRTGRPFGDDFEAVARREKLAALRAAGLRIETYACDVANRTALTETLSRIRRDLGPITAVLHNAGIPDGAFLSTGDKSVVAYASALEAKLMGALLLDELTNEDPIQAFVMAGSLTGLLGKEGHAAYTGANSFLDVFAVDRRRRGKPAVSIDWCEIREMGMAARLQKGRSFDVGADSADVGPLFCRALAANAPQVAMLIPSIASILGKRSGVNADVDGTQKPVSASVALRQDPPQNVAANGRALEASLAAVWAAVLGYESVSSDADFYELGGDSIAGMRIVEQIVYDLGHSITLVDLFETGTIAALAERLRSRASEKRPESRAVHPAPLRSHYPVAWEQLAVLRAEAAADMGVAYNLPSGLKLPDDVDMVRLQSAVNALVERHEILRTRFIPADSADGEPVMEILPPRPAVFEEIELPGNIGLEEALNAYVRPFSLWVEVPMRFILGRVNGKPRALLLDVHHALADAFSMELLLAELAALYAGTAGLAPTLHLKDYAWWSREGDGSTVSEDARVYWLDRFKGPLPKLDLPADRPRPTRSTRRVDSVEFHIAPDTLDRLRGCASERRTTPFTIVASAWALLLARYARTEDLVIAVPFDSREGMGMAGMTGMLVSLLPLRLAVLPTDRVTDLIQRTHTANAEAQRHRTYGLVRLLADLAPPAAPSRALLSEVMLSYMNFAESGGQERGVSGFVPFGLVRHDGKSDLAIYVRDLPSQMTMTVEYYTDLFDRERMDRMGRHLSTLLSALVSADSDGPVADLPLIDAEEAAWLTAVGQGPSIPLPLGRGLFGVFSDRAAAAPDAIALEGSGLQLTYAELLSRAGGVAECLHEAGVSTGDRVALQVERNAGAIVLVLGIIAAGAVYVPLDPAWPAKRVAWILENSECRAVIADAIGRDQLPIGSPALEAESLIGATAVLKKQPPTDGPAYVMYTSGSTGAPKGVIVPQAAILRLALSCDESIIKAQDRVVQTGPIAFDASTFEIWGTLLNGARLCVATRDEVLDPDAFAAILNRYRATVLWITTGLFNRQVDVTPSCFKDLRIVLTGGDVVSVPHAARALRACPDVIFLNCYGPTENTTFTTIHHMTVADTLPGPVPIGRPIAHTHVTILDPSGALAPLGVWGEIIVGGLGLADGYLNCDIQTAENFVNDSAKSSQRFYRTGDLGRWRADGVLEFGGRRDSQIKLRGFRIELGEIEQALNNHPAIAASAALFIKDADAEGSIVGCIQPLTESPSTADLRDWLGRRLPDYMVPRRFVTLPVLPVTVNGKLDRELMAASLPPLDESDGAIGEPPRNGSERLVADIFSEVFGLTVDDRNAGFFDLGGHSLLAIKVVNRLAQSTGVRLSMSDFFATPTVSGLAALIDVKGAPSDVIVRMSDAPSYPASHSQSRLYLASRMAGGTEGVEAVYNISVALPFSGSLDLEALREALRLLASRHEALRTSFAEEDGRIVQHIAANAVPILAVDDITSEADPRAESLRRARREASTPFNLEESPLLRARAVKMSKNNPDECEDWLVLLVLHHIVGDGWSLQILLHELGVFYRTAKHEETPPLPALPVAYRDYAAWQNRRDWTDSAAHWRSVLAGAPERITIQADQPAQAVQSHRGDTVSRVLSADLAKRLALYARQRGTTTATLGLALFASLLYRLTRQGDMVIGMGVAGRDRFELEGLIGFFVNILPLRIQIGDDTEFGSLVDRVHASMMTAMDHRDYPFDLLVRTMAPRRVGNRQPLINVVYEYQRFEDLVGGNNNKGEGDGALVEQIFGSSRPVDPDFVKALTDAIRTPTAKHDLLLFLTERSDACEFILEYDTDLLDQSSAERWLGYLEQFASMVTSQIQMDIA